MFLTGMSGFGLEETPLTPLESPEDLRGIVNLFGEGGWLENVLLLGVIGVLEGRSTGAVKFRKESRGDGDGSRLRKSLLLGVRDVPLMPVGTEGRENAGSSSSSSIEGKAWLKPLKS